MEELDARTFNFDDAFLHLKGKKAQITFKNCIYVGKLYFAGMNEFLNVYQVTLNRTPFYPMNPKTIKEL